MSHIAAVVLGCSLSLALISGSTEAATTRTTDALNLRSGPSAHDWVVAVIPAGAEVDVTNCDSEWCQLTWNKFQGYTEGQYLLSHVTDKVVPMNDLKLGRSDSKTGVKPLAERYKSCKSQWALADLDGDGVLSPAEVAHYNSAVRSPLQPALEDIDRVTEQNFMVDCTTLGARE